MWGGERCEARQMPQPTADVIRRIVRQFEAGGTEALETPELFRQISAPGENALAALQKAGKPAELLRQTKEGLFVA